MVTSIAIVTEKLPKTHKEILITNRKFPLTRTSRDIAYCARRQKTAPQHQKPNKIEYLEHGMAISRNWPRYPVSRFLPKRKQRPRTKHAYL